MHSVLRAHVSMLVSSLVSLEFEMNHMGVCWS